MGMSDQRRCPEYRVHQQSTGRAISRSTGTVRPRASVDSPSPGAKHTNLAIAINGPTSLIIESIATRLGAVVARAEVGEANVVQLADQLRDKGYTVRLLGEGSNGGNITHPSKVRDPLNTLVSLIKLLTSETLFAEVTNQMFSWHPYRWKTRWHRAETAITGLLLDYHAHHSPAFELKNRL